MAWTVKRIVPHDDEIIQENYKHIVDMFPDCVVVEDDGGVYRFQPNNLLRYIIDNENMSDTRNSVLTRACLAYHRGHCTLQEWAKFNMDIGYSLCGWLDIFSDRLWPDE